MRDASSGTVGNSCIGPIVCPYAARVRPTRPEDEALERLRRIERAIDEQLRETAERGDLSGLPGEGAPLPPDADQDAGERWAAAHVLRNANAVPEWVDLRREIDTARERLVRRVRAHREW